MSVPYSRTSIYFEITFESHKSIECSMQIRFRILMLADCNWTKNVLTWNFWDYDARNKFDFSVSRKKNLMFNLHNTQSLGLQLIALDSNLKLHYLIWNQFNMSFIVCRMSEASKNIKKFHSYPRMFKRIVFH